MQAILKGDVRGAKKFKTKTGKNLFLYRVEVKDHEGVPDLVDVMSTKDGRKQGPAEIPVSITLARDQKGNVTGLKIWEQT